MPWLSQYLLSVDQATFASPESIRLRKSAMALSCSFSRSACAARAPQTRRSVQTARRVSVHAEAQVKVSAGQVTDDTWEAKVGCLLICSSHV
jgi:hypothetical protein